MGAEQDKMMAQIKSQQVRGKHDQERGGARDDWSGSENKIACYLSKKEELSVLSSALDYSAFPYDRIDAPLAILTKLHPLFAIPWITKLLILLVTDFPSSILIVIAFKDGHSLPFNQCCKRQREIESDSST